ncbi:MAG: SCO family protein [Aliishimia sp.]
MLWRSLAVCACLGTSALADTPFPADIGGPFQLIDQHEALRTEVDPKGQAQLVFFGYANCLNICSAALPLMAQVTDAMALEGHGVTPILITIAPDQDTVDTMDAPLAELHPEFVGLTGDEYALSVAYDAFNVKFEPLFEDPEYGWIYSHTGFVHLLDGEGELLTLLPPILNAEQMTGIVRKYLSGQS